MLHLLRAASPLPAYRLGSDALSPKSKKITAPRPRRSAPRPRSHDFSRKIGTRTSHSKRTVGPLRVEEQYRRVGRDGVLPGPNTSEGAHAAQRMSVLPPKPDLIGQVRDHL